MTDTVRKSLFVALGVVLFFCLLAIIAWAFVDTQVIRERVERTASNSLGMEVKVNGPATIQLFPVPGLRLEDFHIRNSETEWLVASGVDIRVRILPLLRGRVDLAGVTLMQSSLQLVQHEDGDFNFIPDQRPEDSGQGRPFRIQSFGIKDTDLVFIHQASGERIKAQSCDWTGQGLEWSPAGPDSPQLNLPDFQGSLTCGKVSYAEMELTGLQAEVLAQDQQLLISQVRGELLEGSLEAWLESDFSGSHPNHSLELELTGFRIERFFETFQQEQGAQGLLNFTAQLESSGKTSREILAGLKGGAEIFGTELVLHGLDLDEQLARYQTTQRFNLVDVGAFFVAGPAGLAITRGYGFASIFADTDEQTPIRELVSEWDIADGVASARDVALSTQQNRLALAGGLNFVDSRFKDMKVAVIDAEGCAIVEQSIQGKFHDPHVDTPNFLVVITGPFVDAVRRGIELFADIDCDVFYTGRVEHP